MTPHVPPEPGTLPVHDPYITLLCNDFEAAEALASMRWGKQFSCRRCGCDRATHLRCRPRVWECHSCGAFNSVTAGTVFHRTRLPLAKILLAAFLMSRRYGISSNQLRLILGTRSGTAWQLGHRFRHALQQASRPVDAPVQVYTCALRPRRSKIPAREREPPVITVFAARDPAGRLAVGLADLDRARALSQLLDGKVVPHEPTPIPPVQYPGVLHDLQRMINGTHQRVSRRWSERYVVGWAMLAGESDRCAALMKAAMACEPRPWRHLQPSDLRQTRTRPQAPVSEPPADRAT